MSIFYVNEHTACKNYVTDLKGGFFQTLIPEHEAIEVTDKQDNHIIFVLDGKITVSCNEFKNVIFGSNQMCFLPKSANCQGEALKNTSVIVLTYNNPVSLCDKMEMESLASRCEDIQYIFKPLAIRLELKWFLQLLSHYLKDGINCSHLHEIKQKELFLVLRAYYTKEELADFFYPSIGKSLDFKGLVLSNYLAVKNAQELATKCGFSQRVFSRRFNDEFGEPPYAWMQKQIARHVKGRLLDKNIPYKSIAEEFKFSSQEHLIKFCKAYLGGTPTQIRLRFVSEN